MRSGTGHSTGWLVRSVRLLPLAVVALLGPGSRMPPLRVVRFVEQSGVNLPWLRYGWDVGANPWGGEHGGFASNTEALDRAFTYLRDHGVRVCRVFLFGDLRAGVACRGGNIAGLDAWADRDIDALIRCARRNRMHLVPVLLDHTVADGVADENGAPVGEHPEWLSNPSLRRQLIDRVIVPTVVRHHAPGTVLAWDLINEPRLAVAVSTNDCRRFVEEAAAAVRRAVPTARLTFGAYDRFHLDRLGVASCDMVQVHYYPDLMGYYWDFDTPASAISAAKPVWLGELDPADPAPALSRALDAGYEGVLLWSLNAPYEGVSFTNVASSYAAWVESRRTRAVRILSGRR